MKKKADLLAKLRRWDAGEFDLTDRLDEGFTPDEPQDSAYPWDREAPVERLERAQIRVWQRLYPYLAALLCAVTVVFLLYAVMDLPAFGQAGTPSQNEVMERYVSKGVFETGAVNLVAGVILDYRAFDTLGESHVLFTAAAAVLMLLLGAAPGRSERELEGIVSSDLIVQNTARIVVPVVLLFGVYVILNGHLGPGGGFSGGAIIGAGLILYTLAFGFARLGRYLNFKTYRIIVLGSLLFYSLSKCYSFFCGANHLETIFRTGVPGRIFSAGLILPLNLAVGTVVACTMYGFYALFQRGKI